MRQLLVLCAVLASSAYAAQWRVLQANLEPVLMGISFPQDANTGYMAGGQDGEPGVGGAQVYKTTDAGKTWNYLPHGESALMFLDVAMQTNTNGVVGGIALVSDGGIEYTTDGNHFNQTTDFEFEQECQSAQVIRGTTQGYALTGMFTKVDGVAVSQNKGVTWKHYDAKLNTTARYGSFPSPKTWYVAAGTWPEQKTSKRAGVKQITARLSIEQTTTVGANGKPHITHRIVKNLDSTARHSNDGWQAAIVKSADGGATWTSLYWDDNFYFNAISCPTENSCWAVGEADEGAKPGVRILHTGDGGRTWDVQMYNSTKQFSLIGINMIDENVGWAAGGELDARFRGHFWGTTNGGKSWNLQVVPGVYGVEMSFIGTASNYVGYATAFGLEDCSVMIYN